VKEEEREEGTKDGGKKGMKEERNEVKQMERMEDICRNKIHKNFKCKTQ
jgi:hypothetical protein